MKDSTKPRVSIVVVDYRGQCYWGQLFGSLLMLSYKDFEIVVVDNFGGFSIPENDGGVKIKLVVPGKNLGFAAACNLGVKASSGDYVVFLNNDTEVFPEWLESLIARQEKDDSIGAVVSKIVFYPVYVKIEILTPVFRPTEVCISNDERKLGVRLRFESSWYESTGPLNLTGFHGKEVDNGEEWRWTLEKAEACLPIPKGSHSSNGKMILYTPVENRGEKILLNIGSERISFECDGGRHEFDLGNASKYDVINSAGSELDEEGECLETGIYEIDGGQYDNPREVTAFSGCSVMIRREVFEQLGGFDPAFFAYYEDTDLSWRMRNAGWKIMYEPRSVVRHHRSSTSGEQSPFFCFHIYRNKCWNIAKNARIGIAVSVLVRECFCWIPNQVNTNEEFSAWRLKRETIIGMMGYLLKRIF